MNQAHIHLLVNHFPIIGVILGIVILIAGFILKNTAVKKTALAIFFLSAISSVPAFFSGEGAEEAIETLPGVSENYIEAHEEIAAIFIWIIGSLGIISLITFLLDHFKIKYSGLFYGLTLLIAIVSTVFAAKAGSTGGEIRHPEIRAANAPSNTNMVFPNEDD